MEGAKLMHPKDLTTDNTHGGLIHITFNSALFGFIDDMYMATFMYDPTGALFPQRVLKIQSQLTESELGLDS